MDISTFTYIDLINQIKNMETKEFMNWYINTIQYGSDLIDENKIIKSICENSTNGKYYKLFSHLLTNTTSTNNYAYGDLVQIISEESDYFVTKCKKELIEKISDKSNLYELTFEFEAKNINCRQEFKLLCERIEFVRYNMNNTNCSFAKCKFVICKVEYTGFAYDDYYYDLIKPSAIFTLQINEDEDNYCYDLNFENAGMVNYHFMDLEFDLKKYMG
jgi:hypothetical protein